MDEQRPILLPVDRADAARQWLAAELAAAIALVAEGAAVRITIANVEGATGIAGEAAAMAQRAGVAFALERDPLTGRPAMRIGPRL